MLVAVKDDVAPDPAGVGLLGEVAVVSRPKRGAHRVHQSRSAGGGGAPFFFTLIREYPRLHRVIAAPPCA